MAKEPKYIVFNKDTQRRVKGFDEYLDAKRYFKIQIKENPGVKFQILFNSPMAYLIMEEGRSEE